MLMFMQIFPIFIIYKILCVCCVYILYIDVSICASGTSSASSSPRWRRSKNSRNAIAGARYQKFSTVLLTVNVKKLNPNTRNQSAVRNYAEEGDNQCKIHGQCVLRIILGVQLCFRRFPIDFSGKWWSK